MWALNMKASRASVSVPEGETGGALGDRDGQTLSVDVSVRSQRWLKSVAGVVPLCSETARHAYACTLDEPTPAQLSVVLSTDRAVQTLNRIYRGFDKATNVLSFPIAHAPVVCLEGCPPPPRLLGDIVIAYGTSAREAAAAGKSLADHLRHLIVHGILHILGYDHETEEDAATMERLEAAILASLGVGNPYASPAEHVA